MIQVALRVSEYTEPKPSLEDHERRFEYCDRKAVDADTAYRLYIYLAAKEQANEAARLDMEK